MASKRPNPLMDPPAASSSEEEVATSSEEEEADKAQKEDSSSDEDNEEVDEEDARRKMPKPSSGVPPPPKRSEPAVRPADESMRTSQKAESGSDTETESETDSESESEQDTPGGGSVKPIASKPMPENSRIKNSKPTENPKNKSSRSHVVALPAKSKRPGESESEMRDIKRPKKKESERKPDNGVLDGRKQGEDSKKQMFQRIFSEDDEVALLEGILDYTAKKGDPYVDMDAFYDYIKNFIDFEASKAQLVDKIRRLKVKYENHIKKGKAVSKPHDQKVFDLSKKIWGSDGVLQESAAKTYKKKQKGNSESLSAVKTEIFHVHHASEGNAKVKAIKDVERSDGCANSDMVAFIQTLPGLDELTVKQAWDRLEEQKRNALEEKLRVIRSLEMDLFARRAALLHEAGGLMFKASRADNHDSDH